MSVDTNSAERRGMTEAEINARKQKHFLRVLMENGGFREAAIKECRTSRRWFNAQMEEDEEFRGLVEAITDITNEQLLVEARRRAIGYEEPLVYQGKIQGEYVDARGKPCQPDANGARFRPNTITKFSDNLLMFLIKGRMPEYRDGPGKKASDLSDDELKDAVRSWLAKKAKRGEPVELGAVG